MIFLALSEPLLGLFGRYFPCGPEQDPNLWSSRSCPFLHKPMRRLKTTCQGSPSAALKSHVFVSVKAQSSACLKMAFCSLTGAVCQHGVLNGCAAERE